jgi:ribulose-phosphate 3-epimerase
VTDIDITARPLVLPSLMSADFLRLGPQIAALLDAGARVFHVDIMDGRFVPNLTLGTGITAALAGPVHDAGGAVDVHLMVERPGLMVELFAPYADAISVHPEADPHPHRLLQRIRELGCRAGLSVNPGTPLDVVTDLVDVLDYVNVMGVNPGFSGQEFIPATPSRISRLRGSLPDRVAIEVDGGVGPETLPAARDAGAALFVSASSIFSAPDPVAAYRELAALAGAA